MNTKKVVTLILVFVLSLSLCSLLAFLTPTIATPTTSNTVDTSTSNNAIAYSFQRRTFYANGRFWLFYSNGSNLGFKSSLDGSAWSSFTVLKNVSGTVPGYYLSSWYDGTYLYYAFDNSSQNAPLLFRRGTPGSNGSITWSQAEQTAVAGASGVSYQNLYVSVDSNGHPYIFYENYTSGSNGFPMVTSSSTADGTWSTASGFPYQLNTTASSGWDGEIIPQTSGNILAIYDYTGAPVTVREYNGTWGNEIKSSSTTYGGNGFSAVAQGDNVHIVFTASSTYNLNYTMFNYTSNSLSSEIIVQASTPPSLSCLSIDEYNRLYCFWEGSPIANHVFYKSYVNGLWDSNPTDWINESTDTLTSYGKLTCSYQANTGLIGFADETKSGSPYNIRYAFLNTTKTILGSSTVYSIENTSPFRNTAVNYPFQRRSFYALGYFWLFFSDGANNLYSSSSDGQTWTTYVMGGAGETAQRTSTWYDGNVSVHYAIAADGYLWYMRGSLNTNGTISWSSLVYVFNSTTNTIDDGSASITLDSNGSMWIAYKNSSSNSMWVTRSQVYSNASWINDPGYSLQVSSSVAGQWWPSLVPLTNGKVYLTMANGLNIYGSLYNGSWINETAPIIGYPNYCQNPTSYSVVAIDDNVYLSYEQYGPAYYINFLWRNFTSGSWSSISNVVTSGVGYYIAPVLSADSSTSLIYLYWINGNSVYTKSYNLSSWSTSIVLATESTSGIYQADKINGFYDASQCEGITYLTRDSSDIYTIKFVGYSHVALAPITLNVSSSAGGTTAAVQPYYNNLGFNSGNHSFVVNVPLTITATPNTNYNLTYWLLNGTNVGASNPISFTLTGNTTLQAVFTLQILAINSANANRTRINPNDVFNVSGIVYCNGTSIAPNQGTATIYVSLSGTVKNSTTTYDTSGNFNFLVTGQANYGEWNYTVYATNSVGTSVVNQTVTVIVDELNITLHADSLSPSIGTQVNMTATATYAYDGTTASTLGVNIARNNTSYNNSTAWTDMESSLTTYVFSVLAANDTTYGLNTWTSNQLTIAWGQVVVEISQIVQNTTRTGINQTVSLAYRMIYAGNSSDVNSGTLTVNGTVYSISSGWCNFTVTYSSVASVVYTATSVSIPNTILSQVPANPSIIFDQVLAFMSASSTSPAMGSAVTISWSLVRSYDGTYVTSFNGTVLRDGSLWLSNVTYYSTTDQSYTAPLSHVYSFGSILDNAYGISALSSTSVQVTWSVGTGPITPTQPLVTFTVNSTTVKISPGQMTTLEILITLKSGFISGTVTNVQVQGIYAAWFSLNETLPKNIAISNGVAQTTVRLNLFVPAYELLGKYASQVQVTVTSGSVTATTNGYVYVDVVGVELTLSPIQLGMTAFFLLFAFAVGLYGYVKPRRR